MTGTLSPILVSHLEKAATNNGFDNSLGNEGDWLVFTSTHCPLRIWLGAIGDAVILIAFSHGNVSNELGGHGIPMLAPLPNGAVAGRTVRDMASLHQLLRRAFQLSNALPTEPLDRFRGAVGGMPMETEAERLVIQRVGQNIFRSGLLSFWEGRCAITGLAVPQLLRASHIKPWAACETDTERLDVFNGLLLAPHLDAAFDVGLLTVVDDGAVLVSNELSSDARRVLGLDKPLRLRAIGNEHRGYLRWHRERVFVGRFPVVFDEL